MNGGKKKQSNVFFTSATNPIVSSRDWIDECKKQLSFASLMSVSAAILGSTECFVQSKRHICTQKLNVKHFSGMYRHFSSELLLLFNKFNNSLVCATQYGVFLGLCWFSNWINSIVRCYQFVFIEQSFQPGHVFPSSMSIVRASHTGIISKPNTTRTLTGTILINIH